MNRIARPSVEVAIAMGIFLAAFVVYLVTLSPGLSYNSIDGNELATVPSQLGLVHATGYPVYTWAGWVFSLLPFGDVAYRANLLSAVSGAGTVALLFWVVVLLGRGASPIAGLGRGGRELAVYGGATFAAMLLAFSVTFWSQAVIAEVYTPNTFLLCLSLVLILLWARHEESVGGRDGTDWASVRLFGAFALVYGLSMGTHLSNLAYVPGFVFFVLLTNRYFLIQPRLLCAGLLGFGLGILQFLWLPLKAGEASDAVSAIRPDDLRGIYDYTLGAFPQFRWTYPLSELPERIDVYVDLLLANFYLPGLLFALAGAWTMLWRHPKAFYLFLGAYVPQVVFFMEYNVVDLEVFFLTSHLIVAILAGFLAFTLIEVALGRPHRLPPLLARRGGIEQRWSLAAGGVLLTLVMCLPAYSLIGRWDENNESRNTGINDFYQLVFERLPQGALLMGGSGVSSYDLFYFPIVENVRPDLLMPTVPGGLRDAGDRESRALFAVSSGFLGRTPSFSGGDRNQWLTPVLSAPTVPFDPEGGRRLTLFRGEPEPPELLVSSPSPQVRVDAPVGDLKLLGYDIDSREVEAGGSVHLRLYWTGAISNLYSVSTQIGDVPYFENHDLGFGLLNRYLTTVKQPSPNDALVEEYDLVVLSSLSEGEHRFRIRTVATAGGASEWLDIGSIMVREP